MLLSDANGDGLVNFADVDGFIAAIGSTASGPRRFEYDAKNRLVAVRVFRNVLLQSIGYDALRWRGRVNAPAAWECLMSSTRAEVGPDVSNVRGRMLTR